MTVAELERWLGAHLVRCCNIDLSRFDPHKRFSDYGVSSTHAVTLLAELGQHLGRPLASTLLWEHPTPAALATCLADHASGHPASLRARDPVWSLRAHGSAPEPIAIIGMAGRFPGAPDPRALWKMLRQGKHAITEVPRERWDIERLYAADARTPGTMSTRHGGFLNHIDRFDAGFFGISPREAVQMDPRQRLMLELAWEALEDAGIPPLGLRGSNTGVFAGAMWSDYDKLPGATLDTITMHTATGQDASVIAGRVAYALGLEGPSLVVNTACSSALVAVHLACACLQRGEAEQALAGAINLLIAPHTSVAMSKFGGMAPDGRCKPFDARADGYVRAEGGGMIVLKPLSAAVAAGDPIYALIRGSAVNNDGFSNGLTAPNPRAQEAVLQAAYARASVAPGRVHYVEAHGTGTRLGDPIEAAALGAVLGPGRSAERRLLIGSIKSNIGHLEAAAGMAGLIKTVLAMAHREIPASLHCEQPNPGIAFAELGLDVVRSLQPWPHTDEQPLAGVSAFGFSGTNCHVVVEAADAVRNVPAELIARNRALSDADGVPAVERAQPVIFVFSGNGSQWPAMGRELMREEPVVRAAVADCDRALAGLPEASMLAGAYSGAAIARVLAGADAYGTAASTEPMGQLALFAMQVALAALWRSWGVEPAWVVGHSIGEIAAAHVAGVLGLGDALRVVVHRSLLQQRAAGQGAMAVLAAAAEDVRAGLKELGSEDVCIAAENGPRTTVIAGAPDALHEVVAAFGRRGIDGQAIAVDIAGHSPQMEPLAPLLTERLSTIEPRLARAPVRMMSTVTAEPVDGGMLDGAYWARNLRQPVRFTAALAALAERAPGAWYLEISPHPTLVRPMREALGQPALGDGEPTAEHVVQHAATRVLPSMTREQPARATLWAAAAELVAAGLPLREDALARRGPSEHAELFTLSAHTPAALCDAARAALGWLEEHAVGTSVADLCYTAAARRSHHEQRLACVVRTAEDIRAALGSMLAGDTTGLAMGQRSYAAVRRVFVCSGQGSQWAGMAQTLVRTEPVFREAMYQCDRALYPYLGWSVLGAVEAGVAVARITEVQPLIFAVQVSLAALWRAWGVVPDAVVGHSMGEVAAAHVAGAIDLDDAARILCTRSRVLARISGQGAMLAVELTAEEASQLIAPYAGAVSLAVLNGPRQLVLAGARAPLQELAATLHARGVFCREVAVDVAAHSPQVEPLVADLETAVGTVTARATTIPMYSTVTGEVIAGTALDAAYWARNLRAPVLFGPTVARLMEEGFSAFIELSPHPLLTSTIRAIATSRGASTRAQQDALIVVGSLRRDHDDRASLLAAAAALYARGHDIEHAALFPRGGRVLRLWTYAWQRERYWLEAPRAARRSSVASSAERHTSPLLGTYIQASTDERVHLWETTLDPAELPYLSEHRVDGCVVLSAAVMLAMLLDAARQCFGHAAGLAIENMYFHELVFVPDIGAAEPLRVQLALTVQPAEPEHRPSDLAEHQPAGAPAPTQAHARLSAAGQTPRWRVLMTGTVRALPGAERELDQASANVRNRIAAERDIAPASPEMAASAGAHVQHPRLLDVCLQAVHAAAHASYTHASGEELLVAGLERLVCLAPVVPAGGWGMDQVIGAPARVRTAVRAGGEHVPNQDARGAATVLGDAVLVDTGDRPLVAITGAILRRLHRAGGVANDSLIHELRWLPRPAHSAESRPHAPAAGVWLVFADQAESAKALEALLTHDGSACVRVCHGSSSKEPFVGNLLANTICPLPDTELSTLRRALGQIFGPGRPRCRGVIYLWAAEQSSFPAQTAPSTSLSSACAELARVVAAIAELGASALWPIADQAESVQPSTWLVTRAAHVINHELIDPHQAALWSLGRVLAAEHAAARVALVDLAPQTMTEPGRELFALTQHVMAGDGTEPVCLRHGQRYAAELAAVPMTAPAASLRADGTYLITGGLGGVGAAVARRLAARGARHLVLMSRGQHGRAAGDALIAELRALGATEVRLAWVDSADAGALAQELGHIRATMPPLRGVLHAAAVADNALLADMDEARIQGVLAPKVHGAWNLHCLTADDPLDWMVYLSSLAGIAGVPGQGAYAAANGFMDALAAMRRSHGLPALSIAWCGWRGLGLAATPGGEQALAHLERRGIGSLATEKALEVLDTLLGGAWPARIAVAPLTGNFASQPASWPLRSPWSHFAQQEHRASADLAHGSELAQRLLTEPEPRRRAMLEDFIATSCAQVLEIPRARIERHVPFKALGMDSMLAVELGNRLAAALELALPATLVWQQPTVAQLADMLLAMLAKRTATSSSGAFNAHSSNANDSGNSTDSDELANLLAELEHLPESEVRRLLAID